MGALICLVLAVATARSAASPAPLKVEGTKLVTVAGEPIRLRGVNCAGLEWSNDGEGHIGRTIEVAVVDWHANLIRLPLAQDRWFGRAPEQTDGGAAYRALVRQIVDFITAHDAYVILDLHWSDAGRWGWHIAQHKLPDRNSVEFWKDAAAAYANAPAVLFDLYNEPFGTGWDEWYNGGRITEKNDKTKETLTYDAVGLQALVDAIRSTGAKNVILAGGTNWAYQVDGITTGRHLNDHDGNGIVYAVHPYPHAYEHIGRETIAQWTARMEHFAATMPMIVTEFGSIERMWPFPKEWNMNDEKWNRAMLATLEAHGWNWTAWDFHPSAAPCLISGWDYRPTPEFGVWVTQALAKNVR